MKDQVDNVNLKGGNQASYLLARLKIRDPEEAVAIGDAVEAAYRPVGQEAERRGKSADGKAGGRGKKKNPGSNCPRVKRDESKRTEAVAAQAAKKKSPGRPKKGGSNCPTFKKRDESKRTEADEPWRG